MQRGIQKGMQQGIQQGIQKGMQQGIQQGMQQKKIHIAKNMFSRGFTPSLIQELSGISTEELRQLKKEYS